MTTMRDVAESALELAGHTEIGGTPPNEDFVYALDVLNDMLHGWRSRGVDIGHETLGASDTVNLLEEHIGAVKTLLAVHPRIQEGFGLKPSASLMAEASRAWNEVYSAYAGPAPAALDSALSRMPLKSQGLGR